jgi:hypothetical protein
MTSLDQLTRQYARTMNNQGVAEIRIRVKHAENELVWGHMHYPEDKATLATLHTHFMAITCAAMDRGIKFEG